MVKGLKILVLILITSPFFGDVLAQNTEINANNTDSTTTSNSTSLLIPPLEQLIDSALANSPTLFAQKSQIKIDNYNLRSTKKEWLDYIQPEAMYAYGSSDVVAVSSQTNKATLSTNVSSRYNVGFKLNMTLFDVVDRRNKKGVAYEQIKINEQKYEELKKQVISQVIVQYNTLLLKQQLLTLNNELYYNQKMNKDVGQRNFSNGEISVTEYSEILQGFAKAQTDFETAKSELKTTMMLLEAYVGVKLDKF